MDFKKRIKGAVTQTLVKSLLEDAGYRVVPLGVEEVIREVISLDTETYKDLHLPKVLRYMPDFFVADTDLKAFWLVEVKYQKKWNDETKDSLGKQILKQAEYWSPLFLIVFLGTPASVGNDSPRHSVRVMKLAYEETSSVLLMTRPKRTGMKLIGRTSEDFKTFSKK